MSMMDDDEAQMRDISALQEQKKAVKVAIKGWVKSFESAKGFPPGDDDKMAIKGLYDQYESLSVAVKQVGRKQRPDVPTPLPAAAAAAAPTGDGGGSGVFNARGGGLEGAGVTTGSTFNDYVKRHGAAAVQNQVNARDSTAVAGDSAGRATVDNSMDFSNWTAPAAPGLDNSKAILDVNSAAAQGQQGAPQLILTRMRAAVNPDDYDPDDENGVNAARGQQRKKKGGGAKGGRGGRDKKRY